MFSESPVIAQTELMDLKTQEQRIEALFDHLPDQDVPSLVIQVVARAIDWQRALRRVRQRTGKSILPTQGRTAYRYFRD